MSSRFATGIEGAKPKGDFAAFSLLPEAEKERLCRSLLAEFGVTQIVSGGGNGELVHSCCLPFGAHKNGDSNPSASLNYNKLTYHCWGCGHSGGLLWFIASCRYTSSVEAREWLNSETGIGSEQSLSALLAFFDAVWSPERHEKPPIPNLDPKVLEPWKMIHPWLTEIRKIPAETLMHFSVGYNPSFRVPVGSTDDPMWVTSERVVIPHFWKGNLVGWQSRRLMNDGTPKYLNSADFPKDTTIYNYEARRISIVVESPMSVLSKYHRCPILEATFGASLTDSQIRLMADHPRVILCMDNDEAGWNATKIIGDELLDYTDVRVIENPYDADPADMNWDTFAPLIADAIPYSVWKPPTTLVALKEDQLA